MANILIVANDYELQTQLMNSIRMFGCLFVATDCAEAVKHIGENAIDLSIFETEAFTAPELCFRTLRALTTGPIFTLVKSDNLEYLDYWLRVADDSLKLPCNSDECKARAGALLHRHNMGTTQAVEENYIFNRRLMILPLNRRVLYNDKDIKLTRKEFDILLLLARNKGQVLSNEQIYLNVWRDDIYLNVDKLVQFQILNIRKKIAEQTDTQFIETVRGIGYRFAAA